MMPRALVHGPLKYQGLGVDDLWAVQLVEHVHALMRHDGRRTITNQLLRSTIDDLVLELGSATPFWELTFSHYAHMATPSWVTTT